MNKTVKVILIIAAVLLPVGVIIALIGIKSGGGNGWGLDFSNGQAHVLTKNVDERVDVKEFDSLLVEVASADVIVMRGDSYKVEYKTREGKEPIIEEEGGKLTVKQPPMGLVMFDFNFGTVNNTYIIYVPDNGKPFEFDLISSSGDITLDRVKASGSIKLSSGEVMINDIEGESLSVITSSGDINCDKVVSPDVKCVVSSGDINMLRVNAAKLDCKTSSGDIDINDSEADDVNLKASSGELTVALNGAPDDYSYDMKVSSGDIVINGAEIDGREYVKENSGNKSLSCKATSGDITVTVE